jgi:hypothetical protein
MSQMDVEEVNEVDGAFDPLAAPDTVVDILQGGLDMDTDETLMRRVKEVKESILGSGNALGLPAALGVFGIGPDNLFHANVEEKYFQLIEQAWVLHQEVLKRRLEQRYGEQGVQAVSDCVIIRHFLYTAKNTIIGIQQLERISRGAPVPPYARHADVTGMEEEGMEVYTRVHYRVLNEIASLNLRKKKDNVYQQIVLPGGIETRAWKQIGTIEKAVREIIAPERNPWLYRLATSKEGFTKALIADATKCETVYFPWLKRDRTVRSFRNGIYLADEDKFIPWHNSFSIPPGTVACRYYDQDFNHHSEYSNKPVSILNIPTPAMDKIMDCQQWDRHVKFTLWALLGRFIYDYRKYDNWELYLLFQGFGGCGKSSMIEQLQRLFEPEDIGQLGNNPSAVFGLAHLVDSFMIAAPDVNDEFSLDQTIFFNMVSGENVTLEEKYRPHPHCVPLWKQPIVIGTNSSLTCWTDRNGNQARRTANFYMTHQPTQDDPDLKRKLNVEMPNFVVKANRAYRYLANLTKNLPKKDWMPEYLLQRQERVQIESNPLLAYLNAPGLLEFDASFYMPTKSFRKKWKEWLDTWMPNSVANLDPLSRTGPFNKFNLTLEEVSEKVWPPGSAKVLRTEWIVGCRSTEQEVRGSRYNNVYQQQQGSGTATNRFEV